LQYREKVTLQQTARCDEFSYDWVFPLDLFFMIVSFITAFLYLDSWVTFAVVWAPRVAVDIISKYATKKMTKIRVARWHKVEWVFRAISVIIFIILSFGFSTWLSEKFCQTYKNSFAKMGLTSARLNSCKWQTFGIRMLCVLLYLPVEAMLFIVIKRHASDSLFTMRLKEALSKGELELIALIEEQRSQL
jgi:hypothetical protein